ncbi:DHHC palmitoyltransferase-domain-containing protein [Chytriomyces sp. MP71]|nr:DHHC palmitoyltransferase-domain-containing protein [Chytriomyces sp. MP71]
MWMLLCSGGKADGGIRRITRRKMKVEGVNESSWQHLARLCAWTPVALTLVLVGWSYYAFAITVLLRNRDPVLLASILYHSILLLWITAYVRVICTLPGFPRGARRDLPGSSGFGRNLVPPSELDLEAPPDFDTQDNVPLIQLQNQLQSHATHSAPDFVALETKRDGLPRYCNKCRTLKPDRSHHCSSCGVCVLRMDHHCIFINCCVGWRNHKYFFLFLFYTVVYCLGMFGYLVHYLLSAMQARSSEDIRLQLDFNWVILIFVSAAFGFVLLAFTGLHFFYILTNKTTIESMERARRYRVDVVGDGEGLSDGRGATIESKWGVNIFDLGARENWKSVMGQDWRFWMLPIDTTGGDGHTFQVNYDALEKLRRMDV